jgi:hypothetical protein
MINESVLRSDGRLSQAWRGYIAAVSIICDRVWHQGRSNAAMDAQVTLRRHRYGQRPTEEAQKGLGMIEKDADQKRTGSLTTCGCSFNGEK